MKIKHLEAILAAAILLASCSTPATLGYLRDMEYNKAYPAAPAPELRLQPDDEINIHVYSTIDAQLAEPFNMGLGVSDAGSSMATSYIVDKQGYIDFPVLGRIPVGGKTLNETKDEIARRINTSGYMKDPVIKAELKNFTITVLGEMGKSVMAVEESNINLLQVVARSGGTTPASKIRDVMVIRTENGERMAYTVNLQSKSLFDSPVFYLQQNDIVYMKPKGIVLSTTGETILTVASTIFGFITSVGYMNWLISR